jgi:DNA-binding SARP family transcriptional activator
VAGPAATDVLLLERRKTRALLAVLALDPGHLVPRGKVAALLWSEQSEDAARHALRQCLLDLRQVLATAKLEAVRTETDLIGLEPSRVVVDTARFERQVAQGTAEALQEAVELYRGDLLEGFSVKESAFEDWLRAERERLRSQAVGAMRKLLAHHIRQKESDTAFQVALRLLALEPFDETVHRALMQLYVETGRRSAALRQYEDCVELLGRELGVEPETATRELYRKLVAERAAVSNVAVAAGTPRSPIARSSRVRVPFRSSARTPLVGRDRDLAWLESLSHYAFQGSAQLALVVGEAGIGKSRLVEELIFLTQPRRAEVLSGRGREGENVLPFAPWVEALRSALNPDVVGRLPPATRRDLARLFPEIADAPSSVPGGLEDGTRIFEAVANLLRHLAAAHPLIIVIEDLHWCDDMTVRLLRFLPRRLEDRPCLLVGTARPEEMADDSTRRLVLDALYRDTSCMSRTLGPLSRDDTHQLFRTLLASREDAPQDVLAERTWRLSEGNPFVVVECARVVHARGAVGRSAAFELPEQVRLLTARCFSDLSDRATRLVDVAAVIGRDVDADLLGQAAGLGEEEVAGGVEELVRRRVLREVDGRFDFRHDRVREVAYARLLGPRRVLLHRQVAEGLERVYATDIGPHCATIGAHYREAGAWDAASKYLARAGFQAWEREGGHEALACFEDALKAIERLPDSETRRELHVHLRIAINGAHVATGSYERGRPHLDTAETLARTLSDRRWEGRVAAALTNACRAGGALERALYFGRSALSIARATGDGGLESASRFVLAYSEYTAGNFRGSIEHISPLLDDDARCPGVEGPFLPYVDKPIWMRALARYLLVVNYVELGEFDAGMRLVSESSREIDTLDDPLGTSRMFKNICLGKLGNARGDFPAAVRAYEEALAMYREECHGNYYRPLAVGLGLAYVLAGRVAEGVEYLERFEAAERQRGSRSFRPMRMNYLGRALIAAGRLDEAEQCARDALVFAREEGNRASEAGAHGLLGEVAMLRDPLDHEALERHELDALAIADALEMRPLAARCHLRLAWLYERLDRPEPGFHAVKARALLDLMGAQVKLDAAGIR